MANYQNSPYANNGPEQTNQMSGGVSSRFLRTYTTMSGIDITAMFDDRTVLDLQAISITITREKQQIWTFGSATPRSISRGKRTIVGSFMTILFDREPLMDLMIDPTKWYYAHRNEVNFLRNPVNAAAPVRVAGRAGGGAGFAEGIYGGTSFTGTQGVELNNVIRDHNIQEIPGLTPSGTYALRTGGGTAGEGPFSEEFATQQGSTNFLGIDFSPGGRAAGYELIGQGGGIPPGAIVDGEAVTVRRAAIYPDQMLPFDITLVAQNEMGQAAWQSINGVEIINEGTGISTDDLQNEVQFTYIAIHREPWRPIEPHGENRMEAAATAFRISPEGINVATSYGVPNAEWGPSYSTELNGLQSANTVINPDINQTDTVPSTS